MEKVFKVHDTVRLKTSEQKMNIQRIVKDNAMCMWHEAGKRKPMNGIFKLSDLVHTTSNAGVIRLVHKH